MRSWVYEQSSGWLSLNGEPITVGYAGKGKGMNNGDFQYIRDVGPLPVGLWLVLGSQGHPTSQSWRLQYKAGPGLKGRSGFLIHGGSTVRDSSRGCIILDAPTRAKFATGDLLTVIL